jgi:hypothetical protein
MRGRLPEVEAAGKVIWPRPGSEGSLLAYCQLLIHAIQMGSWPGGRFENDVDA